MVPSRILMPKIVLMLIWEWEGHGTPPAAIGVNDHFLADETKSALEDKALDVLADLHLAAGSALTKDFRNIVRILATGAVRFSALIGNIQSGETGGILVSASGDEAVRVLRDDDMVAIERIPAEMVAESLVDMLPEMPPARLQPVAIPQSRYNPNGPVRDEQFDFTMPTKYGSQDPAQRPRELMAAKRAGLHQLYASNGDARSKPLTVVDVAGEGRVLTFVSEAPREEPKINFLPGTRQNLVRNLHASRPR